MAVHVFTCGTTCHDASGRDEEQHMLMWNEEQILLIPVGIHMFLLTCAPIQSRVHV